MTTQPLQILNDAKYSSAPNFKRVDNRKLCYFCRFAEYIIENKRNDYYKCIKHDIFLGHHDEPQLMAEFCCDDYRIG